MSRIDRISPMTSRGKRRAFRLGEKVMGRRQFTRRDVRRRRVETSGQFESLEERTVLAPVPIVSLTDPGSAMIGENLGFNVTFDNQPTGPPAVGYGPYVDLFLDTTGADGVAPGGTEPTDYDGLGSITANYLGVSLPVVSVTLGPGASFTHPFATDGSGNPLSGTAPAGFVEGDTLYVIELPFGSYVGSQPTADIAIGTSLSVEADLGVDLIVAAVGGFRFGTDPLDNPTSDTPIRGGPVTQTVSPAIATLTKQYSGPEDETATGPNFPRQYTIRADVATGQTVNDLRLIDILPNDLAFLRIVSTSPGGGTVEQLPAIGAAANSPNNDLVVHFSSIVGSSSTSDASVTIEFFVPDVDADGGAVISPTTGNDVTSVNDGRLTGSWIPTDPSDTPSTVNVIDQANSADNHALANKSIAIQKSVQVVNDTGASGPTPGDTMMFTLNFQISDYFSFDAIQIEDIISDGQRVAGSPTGPFTGPFQLTVTDRTGTVTGTFLPSTVAGATNLLIDTSQIGNDLNPATDGSTRLVFDVSRALVDLGAADGILQGGRATSPGAGPVSGTITFQTIIQQEFSDTYPSGDPTIDLGDRLDNQVTIQGSVVDNANLGSILGTESDVSSASYDIVTGDMLKTVFAINSIPGPNDPSIDPRTGLSIGPSYASNVQVRPGDTVTYRLRYSLPSGDVEQFRITDFLPLPVFDVSTFNSSINTAINAAPPAAGTAKYGPDHTFSRIPPGAAPTQNPTLTVNSSANSLTFDFGTFDDPPPEQPSVVDLLISVRITDAPMADGLFLTNLAIGIHGTTNTQPVVDQAIIQIVLTEPVLEMRKGVVATSNPSGVFDATVAPGGITFEPPGLNTPARSFTGGTIQSTNLGATATANLSNVDAGDLVKFAVIIENTGTSSAGAYDIRIRDDLPTGFVIPVSGPGLNLEVFDGTGASISFAMLGAGFFDPNGGIQLDDPGPTPSTIAGSPPMTINGGAIDEFDATSGRNVAVVTFDLQVADDVQPGQTTGLLNTATVFNYAGSEAGQDHTNPNDLTDTAQVTIAVARHNKAIVATSEAHTGVVGGLERVAVGEIIRYRLVTELPEGESPGVRIRDRLPRGLQFVDDGTATIAFVSSLAGGLTSSVASLSGASVVGTSAFEPVFPLPATTISGGPFTTGRDPIFSVGTLTNSERDDDVEYIIVEFNALVGNSTSATNDAGDTRRNRYRVEIDGRTNGGISNAARVRIAEPALTLTKTAVPTAVDAGDTVTYTVTYSNGSGSNRADAFDVRLLDTLPPDITLDLSSLVITPSGGALGVTDASATNTIDVTVGVMPQGASVTLVYSGTIGLGISPNEILNNSARVTYTSLPGSTGTVVNPTGSATPGGSGTDSGERDGSGTGMNDHFASATAPVTGQLPVARKTLVVTSIDNANNNNGQAVIGEVVTYEVQVDVPEGTANAVQIADSMDAGLAFVDVVSVSASPGLSIANTIGIGTNPANVVVSNGGRDVSFNMGDVVNSDTDNGVTETITIRYRVVALNVGSNQSVPVTDLDNSAQLNWTGNSISPVSAAAVRVLEPELAVSKTASPSQVDALDLVTVTLVIDHAASSDTDAYDVRLADALPIGFTYVANSLTHISGVAPASLAESAGSINAFWPVLLLGQSSTVQLQVIVTAVAQAGSSLVNRADIDWSSLPGVTSSDLSVHNPNSRERTGIGGINDYVDSDFATVSVDVALNKSIVQTSEASTTAANVTIGEIVRYRVWLQLPEGSAPGLQIVDVLPAGIQFLDDGSARFAFVSNGAGITSSTLGGGFVQPGASGAVTPTFVLPPTAISGGPFVDGTDPTFSFGDMVNQDDDVDAEFVIVEFNALVLNVSQNVQGATHVNRFRALVSGAQVGPTSNGETTTVVEPSITDVTKTVLSPTGGIDAGQTATYSVAYSNSSSPGSTSAFDARLVDTLPPQLANLANVRVFRNGGQIVTGFSNNSTSTTLDVSVDRLSPGDQIEVRYDVTVVSSTLPGSSVSNAVNLQYTSLPGPQGTDPNPTGSLPGSAGAVGGERTGAGGVNAYSDAGSSNLPLFSHTISGFVYRDQNNNGVFDDGVAAATSGVTVQLTGIDHLAGNVNRSTITNGVGAYTFGALRPGDYTITEVQPAGLLNGLDTIGSPALGATNPARYDDSLGTFSIAVGTPSTVSINNNFGELDSATISGFVYVDANNDGLRGAEVGIGGVVVSLTGTDDQGNSVNQVASTGPGGAYQFAGLRPGSYQVDETQPVSYVDGFETRGNVLPIPNSAGGPDTIGGITILPGQASTNNNFGDVPPSDLLGQVFVDIANDATFSGNDFGLGGIAIELTGIDVNGQAVASSTTTAADGTYRFTQLMAGTYTVTEPVQPALYFDGQETLNFVPLVGSIGTDSVSNIVVGIGGSAVGNNFAEVPNVGPLGYVYIDANRNGVRDAGEIGIAGVLITLTGIGVDVFGNAISPQTTLTDASGLYQFVNLAPGRFSLIETQPSGFQDEQEENGTPPAAIVNNDQFIDIDLTDSIVGGDYNFGELSPNGSLSGSVYVDQNNNRRRDASEIGLSGVTVTVIDENNPTTRVSVVTDANGNYQFVGMFPGSYRLEETQPINFVDGRETPGSAGGFAGNDVISGITVGVNEAATGYLFGELGVRPDRVTKREFLASTNPGSDFTGQPGSGLAALGVPLGNPPVLALVSQAVAIGPDYSLADRLPDFGSVFDSADLIQIFASGEFQDASPSNSTWATGDWNCDAEFTSADLILALGHNPYLAAGPAAVAAALAGRELADRIDAIEAVFAGE